jgi:kynurenine formamidase
VPFSDAFWQRLDASKLYDLSHPMEPSMPVSPNHPGFRMALIRRHGDMMRADGSSAANEIIVTGGHVGTHMDALAHVSYKGKLHGGLDAHETQKGGRFQQLGIDDVEPIICRGVLLDVAGLHGVETLDPGTSIEADDLKQASAQAGVGICAGDAILVRSGWAQNWANPPLYLGQEGGAPGVDVSAAKLISEWRAVLTGHDSLAYEQIKPSAGHGLLPVHRMLLVEQGIYILENLNLEELARDRIYEFMLVVNPLKIVGATGSPVRPIAMVLP